jgi:hypothetical protein
MRGIDRVIAVILLVGAVGGAAAFARHSGNDLAGPGVPLSAPPLQHVGPPGSVLVAPSPVQARVRRANVIPAHRVTVLQATLRRPVRAAQPQPGAQAPVSKPASSQPAPLQPGPAPAAPTPPPELRALAVVQPAPAAQPEPVKRKGKGHGHAWGQFRHDDPAPEPEAQAPPPADVPVVLPPADEPSSDQPGDENGDEHGHGFGHDKGGGPKQSGD